MTFVTNVYYIVTHFLLVDTLLLTGYLESIWFAQKLSANAVEIKRSLKMVNTVRAFVIALALTGTAASIHVTPSFTVPVAKPKLAGFPVPMCPPSDPNGCGIGDHNK